MLSSRFGYLTGLLAGLALLGCAKRPEPVLRQGLPWYEDAPDAALAAARAEHKLVLVDLWAPWCHSCLSMQNFVLTAENLPQITSHFVLLAVDTERADNAPFLQALPVAVWPTFYVVNPELQVFGRWLGSAAPAQLARFLSESERAAQLEGSERLPDSDPTAQLRLGDGLAMRGEHVLAADAYARALELAPVDWPRRPETLVAQITALSKARADTRCLELASAGMQHTGSAASASDFASYALGCAERVAAGDALAPQVRRAVEQRLTPLCQQGTSELAPDDRADACANLAEARSALGDAPGERAATLQRLDVLERAAAGKPDAVAIAYDWALTGTLLELGRAAEALERAILRERALPDNYNPPQYQARAYKELGRYDEGLRAIERAIQLAYGPRRLSFLTLKADLLVLANRKDEARQVVEEQLAGYRALPDGQKQPAAEARIEQRLANWH